MNIPAGWTLKQSRVYLERENKKWPSELVEIPREQWPSMDADPARIGLFRSRKYIAQVFREKAAIRISVCRTQLKPGTVIRNKDDAIFLSECQ